MTILFYQGNCVVRKNGKNNCTTGMMNYLSFIGHVTFLHGVHRDVENAATKNCLAIEYLGKVFVCLRHLAVSGLQLTNPWSIWQLSARWCPNCRGVPPWAPHFCLPCQPTKKGRRRRDAPTIRHHIPLEYFAE